MKSMFSVIGLPVISNGKKLGRVAEAALSDDLTRLTGIYAECGFKGSRFIPSGQMRLIGDVAILCDGEGYRARVQRVPWPKRAVTTDGRRLGAITGVMLDESTFAVVALQLSLGLIDDLLSGRKWISSFSVSPASGDIVLDEGERFVRKEETQ